VIYVSGRAGGKGDGGRRTFTREARGGALVRAQRRVAVAEEVEREAALGQLGDELHAERLAGHA
jgi:hypothetical protein